MTTKHLLTLIPFVLLAALALGLPVPAPAAPQTHYLTLDMAQYGFSPGRVRVNAGDTVVLTLQADDVVHGFYLDGYGIQQRVEPGIPRQVTFTADRRGKFRYRCSVSCGPTRATERVATERVRSTPIAKLVLCLARLCVYLAGHNHLHEGTQVVLEARVGEIY